jgi:hypothetical protein
VQSSSLNTGLGITLSTKVGSSSARIVAQVTAYDIASALKCAYGESPANLRRHFFRLRPMAMTAHIWGKYTGSEEPPPTYIVRGGWHRGKGVPRSRLLQRGPGVKSGSSWGGDGEVDISLLYRNLREGTHRGRRRSDPEASPRMRQLIPTIHCPNDFAAYPGYRQFRNRLLLVESFCECHLGPAKSRSWTLLRRRCTRAGLRGLPTRGPYCGSLTQGEIPNSVPSPNCAGLRTPGDSSGEGFGSPYCSHKGRAPRPA